VQKRILPLALTAVLFISLIGWNCTKLDTTDLGSDLLPAVDNIKTFDTTLVINTTNGGFNDTQYVGKYEDYTLGAITNDPLFGRTTANIYMQLKPSFYPFYFGNSGDTTSGPGLGIDSVVLCLKYVGFWGDSSAPVSLEVREINDADFKDSVKKENSTVYKPSGIGALLGTANVNVLALGNYIRLNNGRDSVRNQIRIKLSGAWAAQLFSRDSTKSNAGNNAFYNDSIYRRFYNGIAVIATGASGNGLMYASLSDTATKLEVHYKRKALGSAKIDSVYTSLRFNPSLSEIAPNFPVSNAANYILRNRAGFPVNNPAAGEQYLQTSPGNYINLSIPGLGGLSNRIIHRAEIIVEQIPTTDPLDAKLSPPNFIYVDLKDTGTTNKWKPVYFDLNTSEPYDPDFKTTNYFPSQVNFQYYGGYKRNRKDVLSGKQIVFYNINISRYVQQIVTERTRAYDMRLYAPFNINYPQYSVAYLPYGNNIAFGRVRIGSGSNPDYRLRLRIVYSKL
jgi:hypothetical protein